MRARPLIVLAVLCLAFVSGGAQAGGDPPCDADASLCAPLTSGTHCRALGARVVVGATTYDIASTATAATTFPSQPAPQSVHVVDGTPPPLVVPGVGAIAVHLGGVESQCASYDIFDLGVNARVTKSCGAARIGHGRIEIRTPGPAPDVLVEMQDVFHATCASVEEPPGGGARGPLAGVRDVGFHRLTINGTSIGEARIAEDTGAAVSGIYAYFDENHSPATACSARSGNAFRLVTPSATILIGWTSTAACI